MTPEYLAYLQSPEWKERRRQRLSLSRGRCEICGTKQQLDVHHLTYARIFNEPMKDLMVLCRQHHEHVEAFVAAGALTRDGAVRHLRSKTLNVLLPRDARIPSDEYRWALMNNPKFMDIFRSATTRSHLKMALRKRYKQDASFPRLMTNAMILWRVLRMDGSQPVAA